MAENINAEHDKKYSEVSAMEYSIAVELNDPTFRQPRLPRRNVPDVRVKNDIDNRVFRRTSFRRTNRPAGEMMTI